MESVDPNLPSSVIMVSDSNLEAIQRDTDHNELSANNLVTMFNEMLAQFEIMEKSGTATTQIFLDAVEEITNAVLSIQPYKLLNPKVLSHPLLKFLHQMLMDILDNWRATDARLNIQETDIFLKVSLIFLRAAEQAPAVNAGEDRKRIRELLATRRFLRLISEQVNDNIVNKEGINDDPNICTLGILTINLLRECPFFYNTSKNERLIDDLVMNCLDSYDYVHAVLQLQQGEPLNDVDRFLLFTCWDFVPFVSVSSTNSTHTPDSLQLIQYVYDNLLTRLENALNHPPPIAPPSVAYILQRCEQLLKIHNLSSFDQHASRIIDHLIQMLNKPSATDEFTIVALESLNHLSNNTDIRTIMKQRQLTTVLNRYTSKETDSGQRKLAVATLAQIIDEQQLVNNRSEMMSVFVDQLSQLDSHGYSADADSTLSSLQALMQHEEMKSEFVEQGGLDKLIAFIRDGDPKKQSAQQLADAMKILWLCTFNKPQVTNTIKADEKLMTRVHQLLDQAKKDTSNSDDITLVKAAEGLIWKVEKEEQFKEQQAADIELKKQDKKRKAQATGKDAAVEEEEEEEEAEQYDLMISYSWADMDLAHRICDHLKNKLGYKIWIDQEQMHGSTIEAMANAVENAQFILMCMSDTYKRSANCQSEAEYAHNRKKHIVPCKMKKDYTADGWLGFILGTRMYIDFGGFEFEKAIGLLDNEIRLQKKKRIDAKQAAKAEMKAVAEIKSMEQELKQQVETKEKMVMNEVSTWSDNKVHDFLLKHNLIAMIPLCYGINGEELLNLHNMCQRNSAHMYRSLKFELLHGHHSILPIATYLRFISQVRAACAHGPRSNTLTINQIPEDQISNEE